MILVLGIIWTCVIQSVDVQFFHILHSRFSKREPVTTLGTNANFLCKVVPEDSAFSYFLL